MKQQLSNFILLICIVAGCHCKKSVLVRENIPLFDSPVSKELRPIINEISGIADSRTNPGFIWAHEDSGNPPQLYLISHEGEVAKSIYIKGITNRDWEDMALANNNIYIAETGDNAEASTDYKFYRFAEPLSTADTINNVEVISFVYADGSHDSEAFVVEPETKHIYLITKRDIPTKVYRITFPYGKNNTAKFVGTLPYQDVVSATMSSDNKELIVKTYSNIYHYNRKANETIEQVLRKSYSSLPYNLEPQGEAVSFAINGSGYFTISEKASTPSVNLYLYKRK
jgi:hypothetical protein